jgi:23S rRNA pseudouridine2605 synthase
MPPPRRPKPPVKPAAGEAGAPPGAESLAPERIAKVLARAGLASRRDAEEMVRAGRVSVNGTRLQTPAVTVTAEDRITVDGAPLPQPERARLWLYHKPPGLVSTARDEQGRPTVLDNLPAGLPRVMTVGRLDLNSEGLLLLTNDGELKRRLELPSTGWLRRYRVRVHGAPTEAQLAPLKAGLTIEGERFQPMTVAIDRQQGANAWLTIGLREGRNREIRRALEEVGLTVNRLIRISYGPFQLGELVAGAVEEVRARVLRDQLGGDPDSGRVVSTPERGAPRALGPATAPGGGRAPRAAASRSAAAAAAGGMRPVATGRTADAAPADGAGRAKAAARAPAPAPRAAAGGAEGTAAARATPRSWGMKSHGGAARPRRSAEAEAGAPATGGQGGGRSWGSKSHAAVVTPRKPGTPPPQGGVPGRSTGMTTGAPGGKPGSKSGPKPGGRTGAGDGPGAAARTGKPAGRPVSPTRPKR